MQLKKGIKRKTFIRPKKDEALIPTKKAAFIEKHRPVQVTKTTKTLKKVRVTGLATAGKKKR